MREPDEMRNLPALVADQGVRGAWQPQLGHCLIYLSLTLMPSPMPNAQWMLYCISCKREDEKYSEAAMVRNAILLPHCTYCQSTDDWVERQECL